MLNAIGESAMQHTVRANYDSEMHDQDLAIKKSEQIRQKRPVEKTEDSSKSEMNLTKEENTRRKNNLEEKGQIVVEEYNEDGEIVRKTPPGYVLQNEMA
ncbi:MAG: hypothetical protein V3V51_03435 [Desulfobacterales bacterium]|jgi:hypothetical protein|nr:hypothetical protein [Desulfobacterales bacterium]